MDALSGPSFFGGGDTRCITAASFSDLSLYLSVKVKVKQSMSHCCSSHSLPQEPYYRVPSALK